MAPPKLALIRCYDTKNVNRYVSTTDLYKTQSNRNPLLPRHDSDFCPKRQYFVFWCICENEVECQCDPKDKEVYYKSIIFALGDSESEIGKKMEGVRMSFPKNPEEPSETEDDQEKIIIQQAKAVKSKRAHKNKIKKIVKEKNYMRTVEKLRNNQEILDDNSDRHTLNVLGLQNSTAKRDISKVSEQFKVPCSIPLERFETDFNPGESRGGDGESVDEKREKSSASPSSSILKMEGKNEDVDDEETEDLACASRKEETMKNISKDTIDESQNSRKSNKAETPSDESMGERKENEEREPEPSNIDKLLKKIGEEEYLPDGELAKSTSDEEYESSSTSDDGNTSKKSKNSGSGSSSESSSDEDGDDYVKDGNSSGNSSDSSGNKRRSRSSIRRLNRHKRIRYSSSSSDDDGSNNRNRARNRENNLREASLLVDDPTRDSRPPGDNALPNDATPPRNSPPPRNRTPSRNSASSSDKTPPRDSRPTGNNTPRNDATPPRNSPPSRNSTPSRDGASSHHSTPPRDSPPRRHRGRYQREDRLNARVNNGAAANRSNAARHRPYPQPRPNPRNHRNENDPPRGTEETVADRKYPLLKKYKRRLFQTYIDNGYINLDDESEPEAEPHEIGEEIGQEKYMGLGHRIGLDTWSIVSKKSTIFGRRALDMLYPNYTLKDRYLDLQKARAENAVDPRLCTPKKLNLYFGMMKYFFEKKFPDEGADRRDRRVRSSTSIITIYRRDVGNAYANLIGSTR